MLISFVVALVVGFVLIQVACFDTTIYLHRALTHRALILTPRFAWWCRFRLWVTTGIHPEEWVAVHRKHHAHSDEEGDPHSPYLKKLWRILVFNVIYYAREAKTPGVVDQYARDIVAEGRAWTRFPLNQGWLGPVLGTTTLCLLMGWWGLLAAGTHAFGYIFLSACINGICHHSGYKNFDNTATNVKILAMLTGGEGLHNNHHGFPRSAKFSWRKGEFDPAWPMIKLLKKLKLASSGKTIPEINGELTAGT